MILSDLDSECVPFAVSVCFYCVPTYFTNTST